jgi:hypothetical protein
MLSALLDYQTLVSKPPRDFDCTMDFRCPAIGGYHACLCWSYTLQCAWLTLSPGISVTPEERAQIEQDCQRWGVRPYENIDDLNSFLSTLGDEAEKCKLAYY